MTRLRQQEKGMTAIPSLMTADDLLRKSDDGFRYELLQGELKQMAPASHEYGRIAINILTPLDQHARANRLGRVYAAEIGFKITSDPDTVRAPDVAFDRQERLEQEGAVKGYWPGAPDLAVEIISPNDTYAEVNEKVFDWLEAGAGMVVIVNPRNRTVTVHRSLTDIVVLRESDQLDGGDVVAGWSIAVKEIFE